MYKTKWNFIQSDLLLRYVDTPDIYTYDASHHNVYYIMQFKSGKAEIKYKDKIYLAKPGDTFIAHRKEEFIIQYGGIKTEYLEIRFTSKFFHEIDPDADILEPFNKDGIKIFNMSAKNTLYFSAIKSIEKSLELHKSRAFVLSAVLQLVCEIDYAFELEDPKPILKTDSNFAKIESYIESHIFEKLTIKSVSEHIFLSPRCITSTIKKIRKNTFHEYVTKIRLKAAIELIKTNYYSLVTIASTCGFGTYSTFYRLFVKEYKISPQEFSDNYIKSKIDNE